MLSQFFSRLSHDAHLLWEKTPFFQSLSILFLLGLATTWFLWRLWRFTIQPIFRPNEPKELPYWIPSHARSFFVDSHKLMREAINQLGNRSPFGLTIAGDTYYVITSPPDTSRYFADVVSLTWDGFLNEVLVGFGCDPNRLSTLWRNNPPSDVNSKGKNLIHLTEDLFRRHLLPGTTFDILVNRFQVALRELTTWETLSSKYGLATQSQTQQISLYDLCSDIMINSSQMALFDPVLFCIDPCMTANLRTFTDDLWKLLHPSRLVESKEMDCLLKQYTQAFRIYQRLPKETRKNEAWVISTLIDQYRELGIHEDDSAAIGDANAYKAAFWIMAYILSDPELHAIIIEETTPAVKENGEVDMAYLATQCPHLTSVYHEVLRLTKRDNVFRRVTRDMEIAGKKLRANSMAIIPTCQLHENTDVYGMDALSFDPDRFLKRSELTSNPSYRPYGGGQNYCPGRYFAMREIFGFVAVMVKRYNIRLASPGQKFPTLDDNLFTLGISRPRPGTDLFVTLSSPNSP